MPKSKKIKPPRSLTRILFRFPILFYRIGLGRLMGKRFLLLNHTGRNSGLARQNVLEVIRRDEAQDRYVVVAAYGEKSDWYQEYHPSAPGHAAVWKRKVAAEAVRLTGEETLEEFRDYNQRHPGLIFSFAIMVGYRVEQSDKGLKKLSQAMRAVYLNPIDDQHKDH